MTSYRAPVEDMRFLLHDFLAIQTLSNLEGFEEVSPDLTEAILEEAGKFAAEILHPLNAVGDRDGCRLEDGTVRTPQGFRDAYEAYCAGGWGGLSGDPAYGGQGLPRVLSLAVTEIASAANMAFSMYPGLTRGAYEAIHAHGDEAQKKLYLPKFLSGEWTGTMNLTEPHCGTDLGLIRTRAEPREDGNYEITGTKIFISAGEHDLARNIIHLVLAKIPGGPEGTRGISLFIVPRLIVNEDGTLGERNAVTCGSIEEKMGIHGNATCVLNYDGAIGHLVGEPHSGMRYMFTMMNEARLGVGIQGLAQSELAYQNAALYARDRRQGRAISGPKEPDAPADPIIVHPDIRRTLMTIRAFNEGARALALWTGLKVDTYLGHPDAEERQRADDFVALLTPVIKGYFTDQGFLNTVSAQQCYGGHGYIREHGMEQFVRDARIAQIYEGANGIQALDLVGRKLAQNGGRGLMGFLGEIKAFVAENEARDDMAPFREPLAAAVGRVERAAGYFMEKALENPDHAGAGATDFLHLMGLVAIGYMWARMARLALDGKDADESGLLARKLVTARFFMERMLPATTADLASIEAGADSLMALPADAF